MSRRTIFTCFLWLPFIASVSYAQNYLDGYQFPSEVQEDLARGAIDSVTYDAVLELYENPAALSKKEIRRLEVLPGFMPEDSRDLEKYIASQKPLDEFSKYPLIEHFIDPFTAGIGRVKFNLYPDLAGEDDYYKRGSIAAGFLNFGASGEFVDDEQGTFCYLRSVRYADKLFSIELGNYSLGIGQGLVAGYSFPRAHDYETDTIGLTRSLLYPVSGRPNGGKALLSRGPFTLTAYGSQSVSSRNNTLSIGGAALEAENRNLTVGLQAQHALTTDATVMGSFFLFKAGRLHLSGEGALSKMSGPAWIVSLQQQEAPHASVSVYRYPYNVMLPLGSSIHGSSGSVWAVSTEDTFTTVIKPEQGLRIANYWKYGNIRVSAWQEPDGSATELSGFMQGVLPMPGTLLLRPEETVRVHVPESYETRTGASLVKAFAKSEAELGCHAKTVEREYDGVSSWARFALKLRPNYLVWVKALYADPESYSYGRWMISAGEQMNMKKKAKLYAVWNLPVGNPDLGWISVKMELAF